MTQIFKTSADASPFNLPGDWTDTGHTVELVGSGGQGGSGNSGTSWLPGSGGGGGAYGKLTYSSGILGSTTAFAIAAQSTTPGNHDTFATYWEGTTTTNTYEAKAGGPGVNAGAG